jgi:glycine betaine/choline ABC-type transport system substrate-binding protein
MGRISILAGVVAALAMAWGGACSKERPLVVGSKNFTEQVVIGEIAAQHLERRLGTKVTRKLNLGGTLLAHQALLNGEIDLYPEYTGTALTAILKMPPETATSGVFETVRGEYHKRFGVRWMDSLGFNNTFAMVIRGLEARRQRIDSLSDAVRYTQGWQLGMGYEFQQRPDGLAGLLKVYPLHLAGSPKTMDLGLLYKALEQDQVNMVAANATDGLLSVLDVTVLKDDKAYFPPYEAALAVREDTLKQDKVREALSELSGQFSDSVMRQLNYEVDGKHRPVAEVAEEFLRQRLS